MGINNTLYILNANEILNCGKVVCDDNGHSYLRFEIDFTSEVIRSLVVKSTSLYSESALMFQVKECVCNCDGIPREAADGKPDFLSDKIVFVDFSNCFFPDDDGPKEKNKPEPSIADNGTKLKYMLGGFPDIEYTGFTIRFGNEREVHFVPFEKSASMSRNKIISFIDRKYNDALNRRLMLDISPKKVVASKYYAYRGLYLTDAKRIGKECDIKLSEETVVVIPDSNYTEKNVNVFTEKDGSFVSGQSKVKINSFDGEGIISPDYAEAISNFLKNNYPVYNKSGEINSFQIRMPFTKGMLHSVDFNGFLSDENRDGTFAGFFARNGCTKQKSFFIRDAFGKERDLRKAHIILTESMFKCIKWLRNTGADDPMRFYFSKFSEYSHALYVGNTDSFISGKSTIDLNYQFLSTLNLPAENFRKLFEDSKKYIDSVEDDFSDEDVEQYAEDSIENAEDISAGDYVFKGRNNMSSAVALNSDFLYDTAIKNRIERIRRCRIADVGTGRIIVNGEQRLLSGDLLPFLIHICKCSDTFKQPEMNDLLSITNRERIFEGKFYAPASGSNFDAGHYYAILRNPHLSRNEQALAKPFIPKEGTVYDTYFGHLKGVIMLPFRSLVSGALGGADYDGDIVKITDNKYVYYGISSCAYISAENKALKRCLPIITIPSASESVIQTPERIPYGNIINTFSNKIGVISNASIKLAKKEYYLPADHPDYEKYRNKCAECTVVTGLEIDAAKTGKHPDKHINRLVSLAGKDDYFLDCLPHINSVKRSSYCKVNTKENSYAVSSSAGNFEVKAPQNTPAANLDLLPGYFCRLMSEERSRCVTPENLRFFNFEEQGWTDELDSEKLSKTKELIRAYNGILSLDRSITASAIKERKYNHKGMLITNLEKQYDDGIYSVIPGTSFSVSCALECSLAFLALNAGIGELEGAIKNISERKGAERWERCDSEEKFRSRLCEILPISDIPDELFRLVSDFDFGITNILELLLMTALDVLKSSEDIESKIAGNQKADKLNSSNEYFKKIKNDYYSTAYKNKEVQRIWINKTVSYCRKELRKIFADNLDEAVKYSFAARKSCDASGRFFWDVFTTDEICRNVFIKSRKGDSADA